MIKIKVVNQNWVYPGGARMEEILGATKFAKWDGRYKELNGMEGFLINEAVCGEGVTFYLIEVDNEEFIVGDKAFEFI